MPGEKNLEDLPKGVKDVLPEHAQEIYREAHNNALEQYKDPKKRRGKASLEEVAHKVAWAAVKQAYAKDGKTGKWKLKAGKN
ncbi:MAG: ChaB family protein [Desulfobaccales bacterium]